MMLRQPTWHKAAHCTITSFQVKQLMKLNARASEDFRFEIVEEKQTSTKLERKESTIT